MACMSGEVPAVVRRRFPSIRVIAMGGVFSGNHVPHGVAADALYQKGAGPVRLIDAVDAMTRPDRSTKRLSSEALFGLQCPSRFPVILALSRCPNLPSAHLHCSCRKGASEWITPSIKSCNQSIRKMEQA